MLLRRRPPGLLAAFERLAGAAAPGCRDLGDQQRFLAAEAVKEDDGSAENPMVAQGARELGLDRVPLSDLKEMSRVSLPSKEALELDVGQPKKKRLTWGDIPGAMELLEPFEPRDPPRAPVYDSAEWINTHYPRYGYAARSPLYSWRDWATSALPAADTEAYLATEALLADDEARGGLVRQAQWELARLWDWQQRRVRLGMTADLPEEASSSAHASTSSSAAAPTPTPQAAPAAAAAAAAAPAAAQEVASAAPSDAAVEVESEPDGAAASAAAGSGSVLEVLEATGLYDKEAAGPSGARSRSSSKAPGASRVLPPGEGVGDMSFDEWAKTVLAGKSLRERTVLINQVQERAEAGREARYRGRRRTVRAEIERVHVPQRDGEDTFLPAAPYDTEAAAAPALPPLDTAALADAAERLEAQARSPLNAAGAGAGDPAGLPQLGRSRARARARQGQAGGAGPLGSQSRWSELEALDRTILEERLVAEMAAEVAPKFLGRQRAHWEPTADGWEFDLAVRPPTPALDLLTDTLEVKYRDLLLKRDAVTTLQRRLHAQRLDASGGEAGELPPLALGVPQRLSAAERAAIVAKLDAALAAGDVRAYRSRACGLYRNGLISAGELDACLAAAAAAEGPGAPQQLPESGPEARDALYAALRGGRGSGPTIASEAAVKRAAGAGGIASLDEARGLWQAVLVRAGLAAAGPSLEEVLAGGEGSAGQVALLQAQLRRVSSHTDGGHGSGGADASSASSSGSGGSGGDSLQARLWGRIVDSATTAASAAAPDEGASAARAAGSAMDAPQELLDVASLQERHRAELYASPAVPAPYPGASRLLRWEQDIYLHAMAATAPHPKERRAALSVHAAQLAEEAGLTRAALNHMLRVAGPRAQGGRYDPATGDIRLVCDRFPTREENRRWCLEALHRLLAEANRVAPSQRFLFAADSKRRGGGVSSPFL
ncbi:hypothetical protein Rsub_11705 [Raphidocelis subcapitata]|uniref:Small ribosomal subunit protein mS35 mitochondrial conserved domain-containing protein n=1 Tax=Raphidocelis subcapitata TaxID=307507 RepID=A0A2V0PLI2_9CHLO|nr:hypothetical protein Rsub_11705 [Raphidocelis subcapitata]|eukprot:GBF98913.1 hypothetical protein Rsub_11705 [Raphidocelis subcapitata]